MQEKRENWIDIAKGIGIILVIIGHAGAPTKITKFIYGFHMPLFFLISGYLFDMEKWEKAGLKKLIQKRFKSYIIPYFSLCFINLAINAIYESKNLAGSDLIKATTEHIYWIFYSRALASLMPNCTPLWFLPCLFLCTIYLFFLLKIKNKWMQCIVCLSGMVINCVIIYFDIPQLMWHIDSALIGGCLMLIGYQIKREKLLSENKFNTLTVLIMFVIGTVAVFCNPNSVVFSANRYGNQLLMCACSLFLSYVCLWISTYVSKCSFLTVMGRGTIVVQLLSRLQHYIKH